MSDKKEIAVADYYPPLFKKVTMDTYLFTLTADDGSYESKITKRLSSQDLIHVETVTSALIRYAPYTLKIEVVDD